MKRFIQGEHRGQGTLLPESLDYYVSDTQSGACSQRLRRRTRPG